MDIPKPTKRTRRATIMLVFLAIISAISIILPIVIGIILGNIYAAELAEKDMDYQLTILGAAMLILIIVNVWLVAHTVGLAKIKRR